MTDNHRHASVRATDLAISRGNGGKNVVCFQRIMAEVIQLAGKDIEQDFRIRGGINVATFLFKQLFTQLVGIGQIAIVGKRDAIRGVNVKRLSLRGAGTASSRITNVTDPHITLQTLHMAGFKHIVYQAVRLA